MNAKSTPVWFVAVSLPPRGHLAMSGDIFGSQALGDTLGIWWVEARDAANTLRCTGQLHNGHLAHNSPKVEKPGVGAGRSCVPQGRVDVLLQVMLTLGC